MGPEQPVQMLPGVSFSGETPSSTEPILINAISLFRSDAGTRVLDDPSSLADWGCGVDADRMNGRWTNDEGHTLISHEHAGLGNQKFVRTDFLEATVLRINDPTSRAQNAREMGHPFAQQISLRVVDCTAEALFPGRVLKFFQALLLLLQLRLHRFQLLLFP